MGNLGLVKKVMSDLPLCVEGLTLRSDRAGYQHELMQFCQSPESREEELRRFGVSGFVISARQTRGLRDEVKHTASEHWEKMPVAGGMSRSRSARNCRTCRCGCGPVRPEGERWCFVATRRELPDELGVGEGELPAQERPAYRIHAYVTNLPRPSDVEEGMGLSFLGPVALVRFAQERCGHGEEIHAVLKRDMAGGLLPSGRFGVNAAWWALVACSVNLTALLRHSGAFGKDGPWKHMKRLRLRWLFQSAMWVNTGAVCS